VQVGGFLVVLQRDARLIVERPVIADVAMLGRHVSAGRLLDGCTAPWCCLNIVQHLVGRVIAQHLCNNVCAYSTLVPK
jgi:hypothetical protein